MGLNRQLYTYFEIGTEVRCEANTVNITGFEHTARKKQQTLCLCDRVKKETLQNHTFVLFSIQLSGKNKELNRFFVLSQGIER